MNLKNEKKIEFISPPAGFEPGTSGLPRPTKWPPKMRTKIALILCRRVIELISIPQNVRTNLRYWNLKWKLNIFERYVVKYGIFWKSSLRRKKCTTQLSFDHALPPRIDDIHMKTYRICLNLHPQWTTHHHP